MARTHEDFVEEDGKVYQVRKDNEKAFHAQMTDYRHQAEAGVARRNGHRLRYSIPATVQLEILKKYGREMDPARHGKMTEAEKRKFDRIIRAEYPRCVMDWGEKKYHGGFRPVGGLIHVPGNA